MRSACCLVEARYPHTGIVKGSRSHVCLTAESDDVLKGADLLHLTLRVSLHSMNHYGDAVRVSLQIFISAVEQGLWSIVGILHKL